MIVLGDKRTAPSQMTDGFSASMQSVRWENVSVITDDGINILAFAPM